MPGTVGTNSLDFQYGLYRSTSWAQERDIPFNGPFYCAPNLSVWIKITLVKWPGCCDDDALPDAADPKVKQVWSSSFSRCCCCFVTRCYSNQQTLQPTNRLTNHNWVLSRDFVAGPVGSAGWDSEQTGPLSSYPEDTADSRIGQIIIYKIYACFIFLQNRFLHMWYFSTLGTFRVHSSSNRNSYT